MTQPHSSLSTLLLRWQTPPPRASPLAADLTFGDRQDVVIATWV